MTPTIETRIRKAIEARVTSLPMVSTYPIKWTDGPAYDPQATDRYLRCTWTPNQASREGRVSSSLPVLRMGVLQIDVFLPKAHPVALAIETAGQVAAHFPLDHCMHFMGVGVRVMEPASVGPTFIDTHIQVPVTIQTSTYA